MRGVTAFRTAQRDTAMTTKRARASEAQLAREEVERRRARAAESEQQTTARASSSTAR